LGQRTYLNFSFCQVNQYKLQCGSFLSKHGAKLWYEEEATLTQLANQSNNYYTVICIPIYLMAKTQCQTTTTLPVLFLFNGTKGSRKKTMGTWAQEHKTE